MPPLFFSFLFFSAITNLKCSKLSVIYHKVPKIYCIRGENIKKSVEKICLLKVLLDRRIQMRLLISCAKGNKF